VVDLIDLGMQLDGIMRRRRRCRVVGRNSRDEEARYGNCLLGGGEFGSDMDQ